MISPFAPLSPHASREGFPLKTFSAHNADMHIHEKDNDSRSITSIKSITSDSTCVSYHDASSRTSLSLVPKPTPLQVSSSTPIQTSTSTFPGNIKNAELDLQSECVPLQQRAVASDEGLKRTRKGDAKSIHGSRLHGILGLRRRKASSSTATGGLGSEGVVEGGVVSCFAAMSTFLALTPGGAVGHHLASVVQTDAE